MRTVPCSRISTLSPLALGALTDGVTVREMAGGFSTFINDGVYGGTRTYTKVTDSEGNTIMENTPNTDKGFTNVRTAYYMLDCLQNVTAHGTAYGIQLDGVETGGKTGTTTSNTDIWFCGITPKYSGAVWVGYEHNYRSGRFLYGRNAANIHWPLCRRCMRVIPVWYSIRIRRISRKSPTVWIPVCWHPVRAALRDVLQPADSGRTRFRPRPAVIRISKTSMISRDGRR